MVAESIAITLSANSTTINLPLTYKNIPSDLSGENLQAVSIRLTIAILNKWSLLKIVISFSSSIGFVNFIEIL
jgi:hypothetical protein